MRIGKGVNFTVKQNSGDDLVAVMLSRPSFDKITQQVSNQRIIRLVCQV
jgi:hypothetical protein